MKSAGTVVRTFSKIDQIASSAGAPSFTRRAPRHAFIILMRHLRLPMRCAVVAVLVLVTCTPGVHSVCSGPTDPGGIRTAMLTSHDEYSPPAPQSGETTVKVEVSGVLELIKSVSEPTGSIQMAIEHTMTWPDSRLAFDTTTRNNGCFEHERAVFPSAMLSEVWHPEYSFLNAIGSFGTASTFLVFKNDGEVTVTIREGVSATCIFDFKKMPFDEQTCYARMLLNAPSKMVAFTAPTTGQELFKVPSTGLLGGTTEWTVLGTNMTVGETTGMPPMSYVDFTVRMKRKPDYWIAFVLLPSIFLVALSYGTFWIQRGAIPARAAFCFISYLSVINLTKGSLASLPKLSDADAWMLGVLSKSQYFCAYTVLGVVVANYLLHVETRVNAALKDAREKEDASLGEKISDMRAFVRGKAGRFAGMLVGKDGKMRFADRHVDVFSRWCFPAAYVVAVALVSIEAGVFA